MLKFDLKTNCGKMDKKIISFCGFRCGLCPAFLNNVDKITDRATIRKGWNKYFGFDVSEERISCIGCNQDGYHLDADCPVRPCAKEKNLKKFQKRIICYFLDHMKGEKN